MRYIIEFEDEPIMEEDGLKFYKCVQAPWWSVSDNIISRLQSAQPERLTDDDFETIRIHLSAHKERLCNQRRWKEAEEYQRIIDRFMSFASAQPEIIRCKECKEGTYSSDCTIICKYLNNAFSPDDYCSFGERRSDGVDS